MPATSTPAPGSRAAVLDTVVRSVTEGRYRLAVLHILWNRDRVPPHEMAEMVTRATAAPTLPLDLTAVDVQRSKPALLPAWLVPHIDAEIQRIFAGQPVAGSAPVQLVGRLAAAVCIDVSVDGIDAAERVIPDEPAAVAVDPVSPPAPRNRLIHLGGPDAIDLDRVGVDPLDSGAVLGDPTPTHPLFPPPPR